VTSLEIQKRNEALAETLYVALLNGNHDKDLSPLLRDNEAALTHALYTFLQECNPDE